MLLSSHVLGQGIVSKFGHPCALSYLNEHLLLMDWVESLTLSIVVQLIVSFKSGSKLSLRSSGVFFFVLTL